MQQITLGHVDKLILVVYFAFVIGIGWVLKRYMKGAADFFLSGRSIPAWVTGLAFISANLGAQEVIGMAASGAKYGIMTSHFYWVGAIPAMVFLAIFMMPFYYGSKARSVPEYLKLRFDEKTRGLNAVSFAVMTVFSSGISMHVFALLLGKLLNWEYNTCIALSAVIVLVYIFLGGLTSAIYNEVLQFFMIVLGFTPLVFLALKDVGGWSALKEKLIPVATSQDFAPGTWTQSWAHMGGPAQNPMGADWFTMVAGLGFVLSFGYWCTDFLVVQRAMAANSMSAARRTPLIASVPKMLFPALVILPGMIAIAMYQAGDHFLPFVENNPDKGLDYNMAIPMLLAKYFPAGILGIGFTALMASFMSGMAGNVTAFNTVWTYDIYQSYIAPKKSDNHYLWMGRWATVAGIIISVGAAYLASKFGNIMDMLQLVFSFVNAPLFATFLLGMFWRRATGHGAFYGLLMGTVGAAIFQGLSLKHGNNPDLIKGGWLYSINSAVPAHLLSWALFLAVIGTALVYLAKSDGQGSSALQVKIGKVLAMILAPAAAFCSLVISCRPKEPFTFSSEMGQNFTIAIVAWTTCFVVTLLVSLATARNKSDEELKGLVYSLTPKPKQENEPWYMRPVTVGVIVMVATIILNIIFW